MLRENQKMRPNIYQVFKEACAMQGKECPIKDVSNARFLSFLEQSVNVALDILWQDTLRTTKDRFSTEHRTNSWFDPHSWGCLLSTSAAETGRSGS